MQEQIREYLLWKSQHSPHTLKPYMLWLNRFKDYVRKTELQEINRKDIVDFSIHIKNKYSERTHEFAMAILHGFFKFWHEEDNRVLSPNLVVVPSYRRKIMPVITEEIFKKLLDALPIYEYISLQRHIILRMLWESGCRISELLSIDLPNINFEKCCAVIETRKTSVRRRIFWSEATNELLIKKYMPIRREVKRDSHALFIGFYNSGEYSNRLNPRQVQRTIENLRTELCISEKITPHSFRHGKAHFMLEHGASVVDIQQILGHVSPNSSFAYLQYQGTELERRAKKFL